MEKSLRYRSIYFSGVVADVIITHNVIYYHIMAGGRLSKTNALKRLRDCLENGIVEYHDHFEKRCRERGIDLQDAQRVLQKGIIYREPELDIRFQEWRYRVEWKTPEGQAIAVIVAFPEENETLAITALLA